MTESRANTDIESYLEQLDTSEPIKALFRQYGQIYAWLAMFAVMIAMLATMLTATIVNIAIPQIMGSFGIGQDQAQWLSTANLAASTVGMLTTFWVVQFWGMRKMITVTMTIFMVSCVIGGLSTNFELMVFTRVIQGLATGMVTPLTISIIFQLFPFHKQGLVMGLSSVAAIMGPALGPSVGGVLIDYFNWRYVFFIGVPLSMICLPLAILFLPERDGPKPQQAFDWMGTVSLSMAITAMLVAMSNGEKEGWSSDFIVLWSTVSLLAWITFIYGQIHTEHPLLNLKILLNKRFATFSLTAFTFGAGLYGSAYLIPLFLQIVQGMKPTDAGLSMMPAGLLMGIASPLFGRLADRLAPRLMIIAGSLLFFLSFYLMIDADADTSFWTFVWWMCIGRVGISCAFPSMSMGAIRSVPAELTGQASGVLNFIRNLGGAYGVNVLSVVLARRTEFHVDSLRATQVADNSATSELLLRLQERWAAAGWSPFEQSSMSMHYLMESIRSQATMLAFKDSFLVASLVFIITALAALSLKKLEHDKTP